MARYGRCMWRDQRICVVIPAYDEARWIARTLCGIPAFVDRVVLVDDASRDDTMQQARSVADPRVIRVRHAHNAGVGGAIVTGYLHALRHGADVMAVMAGDHQMLAEELPLLLDAVILGRADYAKGNRLSHPLARRMPLLRRWGSRALSALTRWSTGLAVGDCQCGYTALRATTAAALPLSELWPRYGYPNDLLALLAHHGARVSEVPVTPVYAGAASGLHAGHLLSIAWRIHRRTRQLRARAHRRER